AFVVEGETVLGEKSLGFLHICSGDRLSQVLLHQILESEEDCLRVGATSRFQVVEQILSSGRVLQPVGTLVTVSVDNKVVAHVLLLLYVIQQVLHEEPMWLHHLINKFISWLVPAQVEDL